MTFAAGGSFKAPATAQNYRHGHASQMAQIANRKATVLKALGTPAVAPVAPVGPVGPVAPVAPVNPLVAGAPPPGGNFKAHIAHVARAHGVTASLQHVHGAIDSLTQQGHFTPAQAAGLKNHNGPASADVMQKITHALVTGQRS